MARASNAEPGHADGVLGLDHAAVQAQLARLLKSPHFRNSKRYPTLLRYMIDAGAAAPMKYEAGLTNPSPPGEIHSVGSFGPWRSAEPGDTPLSGDYTFDHADLGVFHGIAGILKSTGRFEGEFSAVSQSYAGKGVVRYAW